MNNYPLLAVSQQLLAELETSHSPGRAGGTPLCGSMETSLQHGAGTPDLWETLALAKRV